MEWFSDRNNKIFFLNKQPTLTSWVKVTSFTETQIRSRRQSFKGFSRKDYFDESPVSIIASWLNNRIYSLQKFAIHWEIIISIHINFSDKPFGKNRSLFQKKNRKYANYFKPWARHHWEFNIRKVYLPRFRFFFLRLLSFFTSGKDLTNMTSNM